jgi:tripartite motif-containing protein 37
MCIIINMERESHLHRDTPDIVQFNIDSIQALAEGQGSGEHTRPEEALPQTVDLHQSSDSMISLSNQTPSLEHITELLKCLICFKKVKEAVLCPHCSKFACELCLKKWVVERRAECPACRRPLALSQIIKCRFLSDISSALNSLCISQIKSYSIYETNETIDKCSEHSLKMTYYCTTCTKAVCSDCVMFTKLHEGHKFERIKDMFEKTIEAINREMQKLKRKITEYESYQSSLYRHSDTLKKGKEDRVKDLLLLYRSLNTKLDNELTMRMQRLEEERRRVEEELEYYENIYGDLTSQLKVSTPAKTIARKSEYLQALSDINKKQFVPGIPENLVSDFGSSITLKFATGCFFLKPYSGYRHSNEVVFSEPLVSDGITWRIKIYPNGTGAYKNLYLSVFVEMVKGWEHGGSFCYRITLVKPEKDAENIEREYISEFENSICWGYNRFCKIEDIENQGFWDREKDQIALKFQIRPANHLQRIKDQSNYIEFLEGSLQKEKSKNKRLKKEVGKVKTTSVLSQGGRHAPFPQGQSDSHLSRSNILNVSQPMNPGISADPGTFLTGQMKMRPDGSSKDNSAESHDEGSFISRGSTDKQDCTVDGEATESDQLP